MPYLKFSRDKRGYENFYLVQPSNRGKARPRVLYWFRTPPGVKVGRSPFDADMRREIEAQNPGIEFDWDAITRTPIPPPVEPERWRERRRVERAFRAASEGEESASIPDVVERRAPSEPAILPPPEESAVAVEEFAAATELAAASNPASLTGPADATPATGQGAAAGQPRQSRKRRRRRGRRRSQVQGPGPAPSGPESPGPEPANPDSEPTIHDSEEPDEPEP